LPLILLSVTACNEPATDVRPWRVTDHDHTDNPGSGQVSADAGAPAPPGLEDVTIVAWQQNCTQCHGQLGRGDGPRGPMLKATNLSDPAWQAAATDEQISNVIKNGKGAMPPFKLPDATIAKLVKLVRMMNAARLAAASDSAAPSSSTAPAPSSSTAPAPSSSARPAKPAVSSAAPAPKTSAP
jgi:cytochrome c oxidase cbb3-type subunit 3